jgi:hypothetical protein
MEQDELSQREMVHNTTALHAIIEEKVVQWMITTRNSL